MRTGGVFVDREVEKVLKTRLHGSPFNDPECIRSMINSFENDVKPIYNGIMEDEVFRFGSVRDNDPSRGINKGKTTVSGEDLKRAFDAVINKIIENCFQPLTSNKVKYVILVGGFAESPYMRNFLRKILEPHGIQIILAGDSLMKAAAEGAIIGRIKQFVIARAVKATFGGCVRECYDKRLHRERRHTVYLYPDGKQRVDGAFHAWVTKGTILQGTFAHKLPYHLAWDAGSTSKNELSSKLTTVEIEIFAWEGDGVPIWCKDETGNVLNGMRPVCILNADLSALSGGLQITTGNRGKRFYRVDYNVCVYFGGTQLHAKLQWKEKGLPREGPVMVIPYIT